jgi:hypothetical protein
MASLQRLAHGLRRIALAHPEVFPLVATRPPAAPWIRPPLRSLRWIESLLHVMTMAGFSDADAAAVYRSFSSFLLGHLLLEVSSMGVETGQVEEPDMSEVEDLGGHPIAQRLEPHLSEDHAGEDFEEALEALLDRIDLLLPARRRGVSGEAAELTPNVRPSFVLIAVYTVNGCACQRLNDRPGR